MTPSRFRVSWDVGRREDLAVSRLVGQGGGMTGLLGWHALIIIGVLAVIALAIFAVYALVRLAAQQGVAAAERRGRRE